MNKFKQILAIAVMATLCTVQINATKAAAHLPITKADTSTKIAASKITLATDIGKTTPEEMRKTVSAILNNTPKAIAQKIAQKQIASDKIKNTKTVRNVLIGTTAFTAAMIASIAAFVLLKPENTFSKFVKTNGFTQAVINAWNNIVHSNKTPVTPKQEKALIRDYVTNFDAKNFDACEHPDLFPQEKCSTAHKKAELNCRNAGILDKCQDAMEPIFEKEREKLHAQDAIEQAAANEALAVKCEDNGCFGINYKEGFCRKDGCKANEIRNIYRKKLDQRRETEQKEKNLVKMKIQTKMDAAYKACRAPIIETEDCKKANWVMREINGCDKAYDDQVNEKETNCRKYKTLNAIHG